MERTIIQILVRSISTVIVTVTRPHTRYALAIHTIEFGGITSVILWNAHALFVHELRIVVATALGLSIHTRMTTLSTASVILQTRIGLTLLTRIAEHVNVSGRILQAFDHFNHIGTGMLFRSIDTSQL